jgi:C_GCAxxG_C_C family probable redox protein
LLYPLLESGFARGKDLNCAETILSGANQAYDLGLDGHCLLIAAPFGGGMGIESICGAATGALMALGVMYTQDRAHASPRMQEIAAQYMRRFEARLGSLQCAPLKKAHRSPFHGCAHVIGEAARILDDLVEENPR